MLRITTTFTSEQGSPWYSTMHFEGLDDAAADLAAAAVAEFWADTDSTRSNSVSWSIQRDVPSVDPATGQILEMFTVPVLGGVGTVNGETVGYALQVLVRWRTGVFVAGRQLKGRTFVPGLSTGNQADGRVGGPTIAAYDAAANALLAALPTGNDLTVWSPTHGQTAIVSSASTWDQWAVMRSRRD